jgi:hypothetical protein
MGRLSVLTIKPCVTSVVMIVAFAAARHAAADALVPQAAPSASTFAWHVSGHAAPSWSALSDPIIHVVAFIARHRFILMPVLICGSILLGALFGSRKSKGWLLIPLGVGLAVFNMIFGTEVSGALIYHFGAEGQATISAAHATGDVYNDHNVRRYDVLIKKADGSVVEAGFEDDDFNVYPSHNETIYPGEGDQFNVRYLERFPQDFVILGEDDSPWAHEMRCEKLGDARAEAETKLKFAPNISSYRKATEAAVQAEAAAGCPQ